jgi:7-cyano-7-deazaguanine synthase
VGKKVKRALLLSGGMDSIALAALKKPDICFTIDYGQVAAPGEIKASRAICKVLDLKHEIISVDCSSLGSGDLAGKPAEKLAPVSEWWPYRNQLLITLAAMRGVALGIGELILGSVKTDKTHTDGTIQFYKLADELLVFQEGALRVIAPAIDMTSAELIKKTGIGLELLIYSHSCHTGALACGQCRGCYKHQEVMGQLGHDIF